MYDTHASARPNRVTVATQRRDANARTLITALQTGPRLRDELRDLLGYSLSGIRKYLRTLRLAGVIEIERYIDPTRTSPGHPLYRLCRTPGVVDAYLAALPVAGAQPPLAKAKWPALPKSSHLYRSADDTEHQVKRAPQGIPPHTPLMVAFFGMDRQATV